MIQGLPNFSRNDRGLTHTAEEVNKKLWLGLIYLWFFLFSLRRVKRSFGVLCFVPAVLQLCTKQRTQQTFNSSRSWQEKTKGKSNLTKGEEK